MIDWKHEYDMLERAYKRLLYETARRKYNLSHYTRTQIEQMLDDNIMFAIMAEESVMQNEMENNDEQVRERNN